MSDENLNLNKDLFGGGIYRKYVHIKGGQAKCVQLRTRVGGSNFDDFCAYVLCGLPQNRLCSSRNWYRELKINLSNIFPHIRNTDTGL